MDLTTKEIICAREIINGVKAEGRKILLENESKDVLRCYDIHTTIQRVANSVDQALLCLQEVEFPVALKVCSPDILHKTDVGGVRLNIKTAHGVRAAFEEIISSVQTNMPNARIHGILVQTMAPPGREVIVGVKKDPTFGPVVMFGLGGIFAEILHDISLRLLPISSADAVEMIKEIRGYPTLGGFRGQMPTDIDAIADIVQKVSKMVVDLEEITELDLNPIIVYEKGAIVVDARIGLDRS